MVAKQEVLDGRNRQTDIAAQNCPKELQVF
jgi:hypothetical protein